jgi:hypothetical protein
MSKNSKARTPLLYIQQPSLKETRANMQQSYSTKNAKPKPNEKQIKDQSAEKKPKRRKRSFFEEELGTLYGEGPLQESAKPEPEQEEIKAGEESENKELEQRNKSFSFKPLKPFRDMDLDEKVDYLSRYINGKAPFPCEFITKEERHRGILLQSEKDILVIKTFQGDEVEFSRSSLEAIKIIGL